VSEINESFEVEPSGVSRRTVTKAMAWAVPVLAVSAAVPAYAASQINFQLNGAGCKLPGNSNGIYKGYAFALIITNNSTVPITINILDISLNGTDLGTSALVNLTPTPATIDQNPFQLAPGQGIADGALVTENAANSSNGTLLIHYTINNGSIITVSAQVNAAPPINGASCSTFSPGDKAKLAALTGIPLWAPNTVYPPSSNVRLSTGGGVILSTSAGGTSGATEPVAPAAVGGTVTDGTITWTRIQ
jgi:hypothetical protein